MVKEHEIQMDEHLWEILKYESPATHELAKAHLTTQETHWVIDTEFVKDSGEEHIFSDEW